MKLPKLSKLSFGAKLATAAVVCLLLVIGIVFFVRVQYENNLRPVSNSQQVSVITIPMGATVKEIAAQLQDAKLIRQAWAFEWYVRNQSLRDALQAGTYALRPSQSVQDMAAIIARGEIATDLVTILPGRRIDQIRADLINNGFKPDAVDAALDPSVYKGHPALVDKPSGVSLEGYLYPESFQKTAQTEPEDVVKASLDEMQARLTPAVRKGMAKQGLSVYEGVILASIVEKEVSKAEDRRIVAQVFLRRLKEGMKLQSDATASYGAILDNQPPSLTYESKYNTYLHEGLPPTPISNVSESSLQAVASPAGTNYLYFVSGDDGTTYFSNTLAEHEALTKKYCTQLCN